MPEFIADTDGAVAGKTWSDLDAFTQGYIECMLFTNTAGGISMVEWADPENQEAVTEGTADGSIPGDAGFGDIHPDSLASMIEDCQSFQTQQTYLLSLAYEGDYDEAQAGRDFWYTRNGHGVGFWDREQLSRYVDIGSGTEGDLGDALSEAARDFGNVDASFEEDESSPTGYGFVYVG